MFERSRELFKDLSTPLKVTKIKLKNPELTRVFFICLLLKRLQ
jgi:hypothetical protein